MALGGRFGRSSLCCRAKTVTNTEVLGEEWNKQDEAQQEQPSGNGVLETKKFASRLTKRTVLGVEPWDRSQTVFCLFVPAARLASHPTEKVMQVPIMTHHVHGTRVPNHK